MSWQPWLVHVQVFSDLHLDFAKDFVPDAAPQAELLIVPGDLGHSPDALDALADWPVPVVFVPGNHEYDGADLADGDEELAEKCADLGIVLLNCATHVVHDGERAIRLVGASRWWDFDLLGPARRDECMTFGGRYLRHMGSYWRGRPLEAAHVREIALEHRAWLAAELASPFAGTTVAITHAGPSGRSCDPRYGISPGTASFCNADDDLLPHASVWIHGHLHCPHDYVVSHDGGTSTRVVCNPRGYERLREPEGYQSMLVIEI